jgi:teichuronic acid biosynthesis glycosyltransferase TuaC
MRVLVVAEYYPRASDPVLGVWTHRQALAAREAGADVQVIVLYRPLPPLASVRALDAHAALDAVRQPRAGELDGLRVGYVRYLSPPRPTSYASWGAWAAPALARAMNRLRASFPFELVHAHYAVPAGDAVRRAAPGTPLVVSVHGGDVYGAHAGATAVQAALGHARLVLANSAGTARRSAERGARATRVLHLGTDVPSEPLPQPRASTLVTVGHLVERKRHRDVISALALLRDRHPELRYLIVGGGPERERLQALAESLGVGPRVEFLGQLPHAEAVATARSCSLFVLPSTDEAFGVAYIEAMAGAVPAIGCAGEDGPEEIASAGGGLALVPPRDPAALAQQIDALLSDPVAATAMGQAGRATVQRSFTWGRCGSETVDAYRDVLGRD